MNKLLITLLLTAWVSGVAAQNYIPADAGSTVKFSIKNFGLNVTGSFTGLSGTINFDPSALQAAAFSVSVAAATVNTGNRSRDKHLKKSDYFDADNFPRLSFTSTKITGTGKDGHYNVEGRLSIKGTTLAVSFPFTAAKIANGYQLAAEFKINRKDFKVGGSSWVLSDDLTVSLNISAIKPSP